jgi:hypothetical protein
MTIRQEIESMANKKREKRVTTYRDLGTPGCDRRQHERSPSRALANGRSYCYITCPYCDEKVQAAIWSLAGGGKRCFCGALHNANGYTYKRREES